MTKLDKCLGRAFKCLPPEAFETVTVKRPGAGAYDQHGRWQERSTESISISASVQPATSRDLQNVEEGRRVKENIKVYTQTELKTASVDGLQQPDLITWRGEDFEVFSVQNWIEAGGYYRAMATRVGP